jgi:hypothetical protein
MDEIVGDAVRQQRISAVLISGFALGALLLAAVGLFGVIRLGHAPQARAGGQACGWRRPFASRAARTPGRSHARWARAADWTARYLLGRHADARRVGWRIAARPTDATSRFVRSCDRRVACLLSASPAGAQNRSRTLVATGGEVSIVRFEAPFAPASTPSRLSSVSGASRNSIYRDDRRPSSRSPYRPRSRRGHRLESAYCRGVETMRRTRRSRASATKRDSRDASRAPRQSQTSLTRVPTGSCSTRL